MKVIHCGDPSRGLPGQIAIARALITMACHRQMGDYEVPKLHHLLSIGHRIIELTGEADPVLVAAGRLNGICADTSLTTAEMVGRGVSAEVLALLADLDEYEQLPYEKKRLIWQELPPVGDYSAETLVQVRESAQPYAAKYVDVQVIMQTEINITGREGHNYYALSARRALIQPPRALDVSAFRQFL